MSVPKQALEQLERAEKALEQDTSSEDQIAEAIEEVQNDHDNLSDQPQIDVSDLQNQLELERQRTASLKGRIDSQLKNANSENKELRSQLEAMQSQIEEVKKSNSKPGFKRNLSDDEISQVGEEVLELQSRVIRGTLEEELENGSIKELVNNLVSQSLAARRKNNTQQRRQRSQVDPNFWTTVDKHYPNASQINNSDQGWFNFLNLYDSKSGLQNRDIGTKAIKEGDVLTLVELMKQYKPLIDQSGKPAVKVAARPEKSGSSIPKQKEEEPSFSHAEVKKFYDDVTRNRFRGSESERVEMENKIMAAAQAGRIY